MDQAVIEANRKALLKAQQGELDAVLMYTRLSYRRMMPPYSGSLPQRKSIMPPYFTITQVKSCSRRKQKL